MVMWSDATAGQRRAAGQVDHILHVRGAHDALVEYADIHKKLVERDILLGEGADQVVILEAGDGQNGGAVELGIVEAV